MNKKIKIGEKIIEVEILKNDGKSIEFEIAGKKFNYSLIHSLNQKVMIQDQDNRSIQAVWSGRSDEKFLALGNRHLKCSFVSARSEGLEDNAGSLKSPMPGKIFKILANEGEEVVKGQVLMILEAMKMEHPVKANEDGIVSELMFKEGEMVEGGVELLKIEGR